MSSPSRLGRVVAVMASVIEADRKSGDGPATEKVGLVSVQPLDARLRPSGPAYPAMDATGATIGEVVLLAAAEAVVTHDTKRSATAIEAVVVGSLASLGVLAREETGQGTARGRVV